VARAPGFLNNESKPVPSPQDLAGAAALMNDAKRITILAFQGHAQDFSLNASRPA
jgi:hypothetical protein